MTAPTDDEIRALLEAEAKATPGPWQWTTTGPMTHAEAVAWFEKHISFGDTGEQHGVGCPTHPLTVLGDDPMRPDHMVKAATTGNGPNSANNAQFLVAVRDIARPIAEEVLRLRAENAHLRKLIDAIDEFGLHHAILCKVTQETSCTCGCDALQDRINEVLT